MVGTRWSKMSCFSFSSPEVVGCKVLGCCSLKSSSPFPACRRSPSSNLDAHCLEVWVGLPC